MIELEMSIYKYSSFNYIEILYFDTEIEVEQYINSSLEFSEKCKKEESEAGENLYKFKGSFNYKNNSYCFYLDL